MRLWEWVGREAAETPQNLAKPMRSPCETHAKPERTIRCLHRACALLTRCQQAQGWLAVSGLEGCGTVGRRKLHAIRPGLVANKPQHGIPGTDFPDEPHARNVARTEPGFGLDKWGGRARHVW